MYKAPCQYFTRCGGCSIQDIENHGEHKILVLRHALQELDFKGNFHPLSQVGHRTRRRASFKVNNYHLSYNKQKSRELIEIDDCLLLEDELNRLIKPINQLLWQLKLRITAINMTSGDNGVEIVFVAQENTQLKTDQMLAQFAKHHNIARIAWQVKTNTAYMIVQYKALQLKYDYVEVNLPINSFLQVTKESSDLMAKILCENIDAKAKILELYCGAGSFTIPMSAICRINAFEGNELAVKSLSDAAKRYNLKINVSTRDLYVNCLSKYELDDYSLVVINPPRNGATPQFVQIAAAKKINKVIMVSCSVENFIRDSKILLNSGFKLTDLYPIDQFLYSNHLELIAIFIR